MQHRSYVNLCTKPWEELVVFPNGEYTICCGGPPVGKIRDASEIKNLWNNPTVLQYRENLNNSFEFGICTGCVFHGTLRNTEVRQHKRRSLPVRQERIPVISFGLTDQCNLHCFMCGIARKYEGVNRKRHADRLPLDYCREFAVHHFPKADIVNSNCFGELFLYPQLRDFLRLLKEHRPKGPDTITTTTTAGSLRVPEKLWRAVMESHNQVLFSIDSIDREIHKVIRGFDFAVADKNLRTVQQLAATDYPGFKYGCSVVLMQLTVATLFDTLRISHEEYGCNVFHFQHISDTPGQSLAASRQWRVLGNEKLLACQEYMMRHGIATNGHIGFYRDAAGNLES